MEAGVFSMFTMTTLAKRRMATPTTASTADVFLFIVVRPPQQSSHNLEPSNTSSDMESRSTFYGIARSNASRSFHDSALHPLTCAQPVMPGWSSCGTCICEKLQWRFP